MEQNSSEWLLWRRNGIGSSDIPAILGISPYKTILDLYEDKSATGPIVEKESYVMEKGKRLEPVAKTHYEMQSGKKFEPRLIESSALRHLRCSLDGQWIENGNWLNEILEVKYVGADQHAKAAKGIVREDYMAQCQYQLAISGARVNHFVTYDGKTINVVDVLPDIELQAEIFRKCQDFWERVTNKFPPLPSDKDWKTLPISIKDRKKISKWKELQAQIDVLQREADEIAAWAKSKMDHTRNECLGVRFTKIERAGNVVYKNIPELLGVDLEKYRGKSVSYIKMEIKL